MAQPPQCASKMSAMGQSSSPIQERPVLADAADDMGLVAGELPMQAGPDRGARVVLGQDEACASRLSNRKSRATLSAGRESWAVRRDLCARGPAGGGEGPARRGGRRERAGSRTDQPESGTPAAPGPHRAGPGGSAAQAPEAGRRGPHARRRGPRPPGPPARRTAGTCGRTGAECQRGAMPDGRPRPEQREPESRRGASSASGGRARGRVARQGRVATSRP